MGQAAPGVMWMALHRLENHCVFEFVFEFFHDSQLLNNLTEAGGHVQHLWR